MDETDISQERKWFGEERAKIVTTNLQKRKMNALYVSGRQEALSIVLEMIPEGAVVGRGDSISVDQVGIIPELRKRNQNKIIDPFERDAEGTFLVDREQMQKMQREVLLSDVFLTGTNAVTIDGYVDIVAEIIGVKARKAYLDFEMMKRLEKPVFPFPWERSIVYGVNKARDTFGFSPSYGIKEGLRHTYDWWREALGLAGTRLEPGRMGCSVDLAYEEKVAKECH